MKFKNKAFFYQSLSPKTLESFLVFYPEFKKLINVEEEIPIRYYSDFFSAIFHIIISQQVSSKVVDNIWTYFTKNFGLPTAKKILALDLSLLRSCGISDNKISCLKQVALQIENRMIKFKKFNRELVDKLTSIRGIGPWTIKTLALFFYQRNDILIYEDLAIKKAYKIVYHQNLTAKKAKDLELELQKNKMASVFTIICYKISFLKTKSVSF